MFPFSKSLFQDSQIFLELGAQEFLQPYVLLNP